MPSGRLHAIGAGNLIIEVQQNSDTTYRVFDWNRTHKGGAARKLHIAEALQSIDFSDREPELLKQESELLLKQPFFQIEKWLLPEERVIGPRGDFAITVCLTGAIECGGLKFSPSDFFLVPAELEDRLLRPLAQDTSLLLVTLPR